MILFLSRTFVPGGIVIIRHPQDSYLGGRRLEEWTDIPYSGIPGHFTGLESCCDGLLCCKYKFNRQHSCKKQPTEIDAVSTSWSQWAEQKEFQMRRGEEIFLLFWSSQQITGKKLDHKHNTLCSSCGTVCAPSGESMCRTDICSVCVCVAVKVFCCLDSGECTLWRAYKYCRTNLI